MSVVEPVLEVGIICGESPFWVPEEVALYLTDIPSKMLHRFVPETGEHTAWPMPEELGCFAQRVTGGFVAGMRSGFALIHAETKAVEYIARPEARRTAQRRALRPSGIWPRDFLCD